MNRYFCALLSLVLGLVFIQKAAAEGYLYLFKKSFPGEFAGVEAIQEEKLEGNLKLTTTEGKVTVWQETLLVAKYPLFDEAAESSDPAALQASVEAMEKFAEAEPGSKMYLQTLINQRKELLTRLQSKTAETGQTAEDAVARYLKDNYSLERTYSVEYLEAKVKRGEQFKELLPDQAAKITEYLQPWAEELQNRKAGLDRFEGEWKSLEDVAKLKDERLAAERKSFFEKKLNFSVPQEAVSQQTIYIIAGVLGLSVVLMIIILLHGLGNISNGLGLTTIFSLLFGFGGLAGYGYVAWLIFQTPAGYDGTMMAVSKEQERMPLDEFIFRISESGDRPRSDMPSRYLVEEGGLNTFFGKYLKVEPVAKPEAYTIFRKGLKVRILADRILIFDELNWFKKDLVVCYTFFYTDSKSGFEIFKTEASIGTVPLPGKAFKFLWNQVQPTVGEIITTSRALQLYHPSRVESGMIELISNRNPPKPEKS